MLFKIVAAFIAALVFVCGIGISGYAVNAVSAQGYAIYDCATDRVLESKNGDSRMLIASTTKIMTAIVALENFDLSATMTFGREHMAEGSSMYLKLGETVCLSDLLYGLMLMSGNDAALAISSFAEGGTEGFVRMMNEKAAELGMKNTSFENPNGLDSAEHYSTAKDMSVLTAAAMENEKFREIASTKSGYFAGRLMTNHNKLLRLVDGCTGVKTGYTTRAGRCLVSAAERAGREIIIVTLNAPSDWSDHSRLYEHIFGQFQDTELISLDKIYGYVKITGGDMAQVGVRAEEQAALYLTESEAQRLEYECVLPQFEYAPVEVGAEAGELLVKLDGKIIVRVGLVYAEGAELVELRDKNIVRKVQDFFGALARWLKF